MQAVQDAALAEGGVPRNAHRYQTAAAAPNSNARRYQSTRTRNALRYITDACNAYRYAWGAVSYVRACGAAGEQVAPGEVQGGEAWLTGLRSCRPCACSRALFTPGITYGPPRGRRS